MSTPSCTSRGISNPAYALHPGQRIADRYQLLDLLDVQQHQALWSAEDLHCPNRSRCTVMSMVAASERGDRLRREAPLLKQVQHPQLQSYSAMVENAPYLHLVHDEIQGTSLSAELQPGQPWATQQVWELLAEVLPLLQFCEQHSIIHGDLHPATLIRRSSDRRWVITGFWAGQGTPGYIAPERGQHRPCHSSDLYSLGMIALQALTGKPASDLQPIAQGDGVFWQDCSLSRPLASLLKPMLAWDRGDRPASARLVLTQLQSIAPDAQAPRPSLQPVSAAAPTRSPLISLVTAPKPLPPLTGFASGKSLGWLGQGTAVGAMCATGLVGLLYYIPGKSLEAGMAQMASPADKLVTDLTRSQNASSGSTVNPRKVLEPAHSLGVRPAATPAMSVRSLPQPTPPQPARSQPSTVADAGKWTTIAPSPLPAADAPRPTPSEPSWQQVATAEDSIPRYAHHTWIDNPIANSGMDGQSLAYGEEIQPSVADHPNPVADNPTPAPIAELTAQGSAPQPMLDSDPFATAGQLLETATPPRQVIFSADDQWMISLNDAHTIKVWNLATASEAFSFASDDPIDAIEVGEDGTLRGFSGDRPVAVWNLNEKQPIL